jgi:hypothetical protein
MVNPYKTVDSKYSDILMVLSSRSSNRLHSNTLDLVNDTVGQVRDGNI